MGFELNSLILSSETQRSTKISDHINEPSSCYILDLYNKINELPTREDIKCLLQKCIHSILADEEIDEEIEFLTEVKKLLNHIRDASDNCHLEIISLINDIYHLAVDKKLNENLKIKLNNIPLHTELLTLFEENNRILRDNLNDDDDDDDGNNDNDDDDESDYCYPNDSLSEQQQQQQQQQQIRQQQDDDYDDDDENYGSINTHQYRLFHNFFSSQQQQQQQQQPQQQQQQQQQQQLDQEYSNIQFLNPTVFGTFHNRLDNISMGSYVGIDVSYSPTHLFAGNTPTTMLLMQAESSSYTWATSNLAEFNIQESADPNMSNGSNL